MVHEANIKAAASEKALKEARMQVIVGVNSKQSSCFTFAESAAQLLQRQL